MADLQILSPPNDHPLRHVLRQMTCLLQESIRGIPATVRFNSHASMAMALREADPASDLVILKSSDLVALHRHVPAGTPTLLILHNLEHHLLSTGPGRWLPASLERLKRCELDGMRAVENVIFLSWSDWQACLDLPLKGLWLPPVFNPSVPQQGPRCGYRPGRRRGSTHLHPHRLSHDRPEAPMGPAAHRQPSRVGGATPGGDPGEDPGGDRKPFTGCRRPSLSSPAGAGDRQELASVPPPTWIFIRIACRDDRLPSGTVVCAGTKLYLSPWVSHRNPRCFPRPERFDPCRSLPEHVRTRPAFSYFPFGGGARMGIGRSLARVELGRLPTEILQRHRFQLVQSGHPIPEPGFTLHPRGGLLMQVPPA